jgi:hypothetical protein
VDAFPAFLTEDEFFDALQQLDALMRDEVVQRQYLEPPVGDAVPRLKFEAHYRTRDFPTVVVNDTLAAILLTADVLLIDRNGKVDELVKARLESVGYSVTLNDGQSADKWSLATITGKNFSLNFG